LLTLLFIFYQWPKFVSQADILAFICTSLRTFSVLYFKLTSHPLPSNEMPHVDKMYIGRIV